MSLWEGEVRAALEKVRASEKHTAGCGGVYRSYIDPGGMCDCDIDERRDQRIAAAVARAIEAAATEAALAEQAAWTVCEYNGDYQAAALRALSGERDET